ncbi:MAG: histidine phosphatase family protein [bacterium]
MTKVFLVRHGETDWNREEVFRGRIDVPLNERGLAQARALGEALRSQKIEAIYSSPLSRALKTAEIVAEFQGDVEVRAERGFIDIDYGEWQGLPHEDVKGKYPELYEAWQDAPQTVRFPGGESLDAVQDRALAALGGVIRTNEGRTVAVVAHRVVNKVLLCAILGLDSSHFWLIRQDTCAINCFESSERGYIVRLLNDTCHLRKVQGDFEAPDF